MANKSKKIFITKDLQLDIYEKYMDSEVLSAANDFDIKIARKNLIQFSNLLDNFKINHGVIYGTLLGLYRDGDLIKYDHDVDIYILGEDFYNLLKFLSNKELCGFKIIRFTNSLISVEKDNEYIDIFIFRKYLFFRKCGPSLILSNHLDKFSTFSLPEKKICAPSNIEKFLVLAYGDNWKTPIRGKHAVVTNKKTKNILYIFSIIRRLNKLDLYFRLLKKIKRIFSYR